MRLAAALLALIALAAAEHAVVELKCPKNVQYRIVRDLNEDGRDDLLVVTTSEIWIWYGGTRIVAEPSYRMQLPKGTALFHVGPWSDGKQSFLFRNAGGYQRVGGPGGYESIPQYHSGPGLPARVANVLWRNLFTDLDGDGKPDVVDVSLKGYRIQFGDATEVLLPPHLREQADTDVDAASDRMLARLAFAEWHAGSFDGDAWPDFAVMTKRGLRVYPGDAKGKFDPGRSTEIDLEEAEDAELELLDLNRDGQTDVVAFHNDNGTATVLIADPKKGLRAARRLRLTVPGRMREAILSDFNGDGLQDLALPYVPKLSFEDILRVVARREVMIRVALFLNRGGRAVFGARADSRMSLPVRVRVRTDSIGRLLLGGLVIVEYEGDLDGDGRRDLVVTETPRRLAVHRGVAGTVFEERPSRHIKIEDCSDFETVRSAAADLNGDASSDIILHYRGAGRRPDRLFVLWSRKKQAD